MDTCVKREIFKSQNTLLLLKNSWLQYNFLVRNCTVKNKTIIILKQNQSNIRFRGIESSNNSRTEEITLAKKYETLLKVYFD